jgi:hypothetical protein
MTLALLDPPVIAGVCMTAVFEPPAARSAFEPQAGAFAEYWSSLAAAHDRRLRLPDDNDGGFLPEDREPPPIV